jgi:hypothetical protein
MELLQAGIDRALNAIWLGHESAETTQVHRQANLAMKEQILQRTRPLDARQRRFQPPDRPLGILHSR